MRRRTDLESDLEVLWMEVMCNRGPVLIGCVYRPPNQPINYWNDFENCLDLAFQGQQTATVVTGDFNVDYSKPIPNDSPNYHKHILTRFNLVNYVTSPTRVTAPFASLIDLFSVYLPY